MRAFLAVLTVALLAFAAGIGLGRTLAEEQARQADEDRRFDVAMAIDDAADQLAQETAAERGVLRQIVRGPFVKRGLLP